jgi:hypothetical protein
MKMEWYEPVLIELSSRDPKTKRATGADCWEAGNSASDWCLSDGIGATIYCEAGNSYSH